MFGLVRPGRVDLAATGPVRRPLSSVAPARSTAGATSPRQRPDRFGRHIGGDISHSALRPARETGTHLTWLAPALLGGGGLCILLPTVAAGRVATGSRCCPLLGAVPWGGRSSAASWAWYAGRRAAAGHGCPAGHWLRQRRRGGPSTSPGSPSFPCCRFTTRRSSALTALRGAGPLDAPCRRASAITAHCPGRRPSDLHRKVTVLALAVSDVRCCRSPSWCRRCRATCSGWLRSRLPSSPAPAAGRGLTEHDAVVLEDVPPRMGGAVGGAPKTGQRIGAAIGAAWR